MDLPVETVTRAGVRGHVMMSVSGRGHRKTSLSITSGEWGGAAEVQVMLGVTPHVGVSHSRRVAQAVITDILQLFTDV